MKVRPGRTIMLASWSCLTSDLSSLLLQHFNGEANNFKWSYFMIFMRVLVTVSVRRCKV